MTDLYAAKPTVLIDGAELPDELDLRLETVVVDDRAGLPRMFVLRLRDPGRDVLTRAGCDICTQVRILAAPVGGVAGQTLVLGEVTSLEAEYTSTGSHAVVRGYDYSHRLHRGRRTDAYRDVTDGDVARRIAGRAGIDIGQVDDPGVIHRYLSQLNLTDWEFLSGRAREIGYEMVVEEGRLDFRAPPDAAAAPDPGALGDRDPRQLILGDNLEVFRPRVTSAEQVSQVEVRGWDPGRKQPVVGVAPARTTSAALPLSPQELADRFGSPTFHAVNRPLSTQGDVDTVARALAEQIASAFAEAEGVARGDPALKAGAAISVGLAGHPFDGRYTLSGARHVFGPDGYRTHFSVSGGQQRSLLGLATPGGTGGVRGSGPAVTGVVVAQVTNVADPGGLGRLKLSFPWLSESYETDWVRALAAGAGDQRGLVVLPEVGDEVLVAFEHGDIRRPYVIGGLHNGVDKPLLGGDFVDSATGEVRRRGFLSRRGHGIIFFDGEDDEGLAVFTGDKGLRVSLRQSDTTIRISSDGDVVITGSGDVRVEAGRSLALSAPKISISADGEVSVRGNPVRLN